MGIFLYKWKYILRQEESKDYSSVFNLITEAFIPELSLVAELNNEIVGHIILTNIRVKNDYQSFKSLALAPVSVLPKVWVSTNAYL